MDPKVFYSTYTLLAIHVWLIIHRLAARNDRDARFFKQRFYNHFQADVERRIYDAGVQVRGAVWCGCPGGLRSLVGRAGGVWQCVGGPPSHQTSCSAVIVWWCDRGDAIVCAAQIGVTKWLKKLEAVFYSCGLSFDRVS